MATIHIPAWPFPEDEVAIIHWISSPVVDQNGRKVCQVYFRTGSGNIRPVTMAWGFLPELWIGRQFKNGMPVEDIQTKDTSPIINTSFIENMRYGKARNLIPYSLYPLEKDAIYDEWCCSFEHGGYTYFIPCVELARVLYARNSLFANQLLSTGGLEDLIDLSTWRVENGELQFDFSPMATGITRNVANHYVSIYGNSVLREGWNHTYIQFSASG